MMKLILTALCTLFISQQSFCRQPDWLWAKCGNSGDDVEGWAIAADGNGNSVITGYFLGTLVIGTDTFSSRGFVNTFFVAKYDANGNYLWGHYGHDSINQSLAMGVSIDADNNVYVAGYYYGDSITFGSITLHNYGTQLTQRIFTVKYNSNGAVSWARQTGGSGLGAVGIGIATDNNSNVYIASMFTDSITFAGTLMTSNGRTNSLLAKYDANGNEVWGISAVANLNDNNSGSLAQSVATDASGNVAITGQFTGDSIQFKNTALYPNPHGLNGGASYIYTVKFNSSGNVIWGKANYVSYNEKTPFSNCIAEDGQGNTYITGQFAGDTIVFGQFSLLSAVPGKGYYNVFLTKYDPNGNAVWAKSAGGDSAVIGYSLAVDAQGYLYFSGGYYADFSIGSASFSVPGIDKQDPMFVGVMDQKGDVLCSQSLYSGGDDQNAICLDHHGNALIGGDFETNILPLGTDTLHLTADEEQFFIAKFTCPGVPSGIKQISESGDLNIYPNPTTGLLTIKTKITQPVNINIYDANGRVISTLPFNPEIDMSKLNSGIYFIEVTGKQGTAIKRFVKM